MNYAAFVGPAPTPAPVPARQSIPFVRSELTLLATARRLYAMRRQRDALLGGALFSEPAWDILLDLFISDNESRRLSVSAVCIGARAPSATALRYLTMLQDAGLVDRTRDISDGRRSHVRLTVLGRRRMVGLLATIDGDDR